MKNSVSNYSSRRWARDILLKGKFHPQVRHKYDEDIKKCLEYVLSKCQMGDWFVLYQLSKNCNPYFFREFIKEFAIELKLRPKRSRGLGSMGECLSLCLYLPISSSLRTKLRRSVERE